MLFKKSAGVDIEGVSMGKTVKIRRALFTVSNKDGIGELALALQNSGTEIIATGRTANVLKKTGIEITPIEKISGSPEAFQGRMKTLSFKVCSGILYRRGNGEDERDLDQLGVKPIDCVVVNFYPFEEAAEKYSEKDSRYELIEQVDIGGPTLVRAAAKNAPDVLVLTHPSQYKDAIQQVKTTGGIDEMFSIRCSSEAWLRVREYDEAIESKLSGTRLSLRYGENPHQSGYLKMRDDSPIAWPKAPSDSLTETAISYNNILDFSAAYELCVELKTLFPDYTHSVIVKHSNPCGVSSIKKGTSEEVQLTSLKRAWEGDPVSAFGGVICLSDPLENSTADFLAERFVEFVGAPGLSKTCKILKIITEKRKKLKAVNIRRFELRKTASKISVPGGELVQDTDVGVQEKLKSVTKIQFKESSHSLAQFGILVARSLKSNSIALVREINAGMQLLGAGQGQPNRVEALKSLALPRAQRCLKDSEEEGELSDCILISDAFFPFPDIIEISGKADIKMIVQPGGSIKDKKVTEKCDELSIAMAFTGVRHFRH